MSSQNRDKADKFDLATDDGNIDFNISSIPEEAVKRSENFNILQLIRRITRHPQQEAVQNDLDKQQSFNAFSDESKSAIMDAGNIEISVDVQETNAVYYSSTESVIISLDSRLRLDGLPALELLDLIVSVLGNMTRTTERTERLVIIDRSLGNTTHNRGEQGDLLMNQR